MTINFAKGNGLVPAIIQDYSTQKVLMLGYMNEESYKKTTTEGYVTFFSRSRQTLWTKGETSGNFLQVMKIDLDCDNDTLLIKALPKGPVCHTGKDTCFSERNKGNQLFIQTLEEIILDRLNNVKQGSYTNKLLSRGMKRIAQKVGEEAVETVIEAIDGDKKNMKEEIADLLYHLLVLLVKSEIPLKDIDSLLEQRHHK